MGESASTFSQGPFPTPPSIRAARLTVWLRWQQPAKIAGSQLSAAIRSAFGAALRRLVCPEELMDHACHECELHGNCAYGQVFMPLSSFEATTARLRHSVPRPFVFEPPGMRAADPVDPVDARELAVRTVLFGSSVQRLPQLIQALNLVGSEGVGRDRTRFHVERVDEHDRRGDQTIYTAGSEASRPVERLITTEDLLAEPWPIDSHSATFDSDRRPRIKLEILTPMLLKTGSGIGLDGGWNSAHEVREGPPLGILARRLRDRLSALCNYFGDGWDCPYFAAWGELADRVALVEYHTQWRSRKQRHRRAGRSNGLNGLTGHAIYEFPDPETFACLASLIKLGELVHVGKNAPWGQGAIRGVLLRPN